MNFVKYLITSFKDPYLPQGEYDQPGAVELVGGILNKYNTYREMKKTSFNLKTTCVQILPRTKHRLYAVEDPAP